MEKANVKGLIYEFPMGVAVLKGGNSLQVEIAIAVEAVVGAGWYGRNGFGSSRTRR